MLSFESTSNQQYFNFVVCAGGVHKQDLSYSSWYGIDDRATVLQPSAVTLFSATRIINIWIVTTLMTEMYYSLDQSSSLTVTWKDLVWGKVSHLFLFLSIFSQCWHNAVYHCFLWYYIYINLGIFWIIMIIKWWCWPILSTSFEYKSLFLPEYSGLCQWIMTEIRIGDFWSLWKNIQEDSDMNYGLWHQKRQTNQVGLLQPGASQTQ